VFHPKVPLLVNPFQKAIKAAWSTKLVWAQKERIRKEKKKGSEALEHRPVNQRKNLQPREINLNTDEQEQRDSKVGCNDPLNSHLEVKEIFSLCAKRKRKRKKKEKKREKGKIHYFLFLFLLLPSCCQ